MSKVENGAVGAWLLDLAATANQNGLDAEALYNSLLNSSTLKNLRRLQYRCSSRCLLLDVIDARDLGTVLHQIRYKYSPEENARRSNESGRAKNTHDGENHWRERTFFVDTSALSMTDKEGATLGVTCDHVLEYNLKPSEYAADIKSRHAEVILRNDGSRYTR